MVTSSSYGGWWRDGPGDDVAGRSRPCPRCGSRAGAPLPAPGPAASLGVANAWLLPAGEVHALAGAPPRGGRPLSEAAAWRDILAGSIDFDDPHRYINRGALGRYSAGSGMVSALLASPDVAVSGMHAAAAYVDMLDPLADEAHVYIEQDWQQRLQHPHPICGLAPDPLGRVLVRSVSAERWRMLQARSAAGAVRGADNGGGVVAPAAVVALDLCVSPHPRERRVAEAIIESLR